MKNKLWLIALITVIGFMSLPLTGCDDGGGTTPVPVTGVSLNKNSISLNIGDKETLTATVAPKNAANKTVVWSTSNVGVATVVNGVVTAVSAGSATITVTTADGDKTAECSVKVGTGSVNQTLTADDFNISGLSQITGSVTAVSITPKSGKSDINITIYYEGTGATTYAKSTTPPTTAGTYTVTFDIAAGTGINAATGLSVGTLTIISQIANPQTPTASDFNIGNLTQTAGSVTAVIITPKNGKSGGAITIYYEGTGSTIYTKSTTPPTAAGTYAVTFDIGASYSFTAATGLSAGTLTVSDSTSTPVLTPPVLTLVPDNGKITYTWTASTPVADTMCVNLSRTKKTQLV